MSDIITTCFRRFIPEGLDFEKPTTVLEALIAARKLLEEEDRWKQGDWFVNHNPGKDPKDPFCNSWAVCAEGAIGLVTIGVLGTPMFEQDDETYADVRVPDAFLWEFSESTPSDADERDAELYEAACSALLDYLNDGRERKTYPECGDPDCNTCEVVPDSEDFGSVVEFNDFPHRTYTEIIEAFDGAINKLREEQEVSK